MLKEGLGFKRVIVCCGRTDLRKGIPGLTAFVRLNYGLDTTEKGTLFLFCGNRADRIKGLLLFRCRNYKSYSDVLVIPTESRKTYMNHVMISILSE